MQLLGWYPLVSTRSFAGTDDCIHEPVRFTLSHCTVDGRTNDHDGADNDTLEFSEHRWQITPHDVLEEVPEVCAVERVVLEWKCERVAVHVRSLHTVPRQVDVHPPIEC